MNRRDLLKRLPGFPFAIGAAVSQGPALVKGLMQERGYTLLETGGHSVSEITLETRIGWFEDSMVWIQKSAPPLLARPSTLSQVSVDEFRALFQWESYIERVIGAAKSSGISLEEAERITGLTLT